MPHRCALTFQGAAGADSHLTSTRKNHPYRVAFSCGGASRTRTYDPIDVNDVLYRLSHGTMSLDDMDYHTTGQQVCQPPKREIHKKSPSPERDGRKLSTNPGRRRRARKPFDFRSKIGDMRGDFRAFPSEKASLHERTAGRREAHAPTSVSKCLHLPRVASAELAQ